VRQRCLVPLLLLVLHATAAGAQVRIAAAGDIACDPADASFNGGAGTATACRMQTTSDLLVGAGFSAVLLLGDNQYEDGALGKYLASYEPSWGRVKAITRPAPGNHEYGTAGAAGYFAYFGAAAGDPAQGWYGFDLGGWHLIALNSSCAAIGGCGAGSPEERWLAADLTAHAGVCTLAYWHHPRFSSGPHGSDATYQTFWQDLYAAGADLVLSGHDHVYERFAPQDPAGAADPSHGLRQFVVGTGGKNLTSFPSPRPNSEARNAAAFGVLALALYPNGYTWSFLPAAGGAFTDSGAALCHGAFPSRAADLYTLPPCRAIDTRLPDGPAGGPALAGGSERTVPLAGLCGVPLDAVAVVANVTAVDPTADGEVALYPAGGAAPGATPVAFAAGRNRAGPAILPLGIAGQVTVHAALPAGAATHLVVDVAGYLR